MMVDKFQRIKKTVQPTIRNTKDWRARKSRRDVGKLKTKWSMIFLENKQKLERGNINQARMKTIWSDLYSARNQYVEWRKWRKEEGKGEEKEEERDEEAEKVQKITRNSELFFFILSQKHADENILNSSICKHLVVES